MRQGLFRWLCLGALSLTSVVMAASEIPGSSSDEPIVVKLATASKLMPLYLCRLSSSKSGLSDAYVKQLEEVLAFDLGHNGMTQVMGRNSEIDGYASSFAFEGNGDVSGWKAYSVYYVVRVGLDNKKASTRVVSVNGRFIQPIEEVTLSGDLSRDRREMHRIADAVHRVFFNSDGVASSRFLYTVKHANKGGDGINEIWEADYDGANGRRILKESRLCIMPAYLPAKNVDAFYYVSYRTGQSKLQVGSLRDGKGHRFTELPGNQLMPAVSRSGDRIAFVSDATSHTDLFVQHLDAQGNGIGKPRQVFAMRNTTQASPTFSPDGSRLAFVSDKDGSPQIYIIDVPASESSTKLPRAQRLTRRNRENTAPTWSPDGNKVAYCATTEGVRQIWIADLNSGEERQLTQGPGNKENPTWAPDSLHLIFNSANATHSELYLVNLNQPEAIKISSGAGEKRFPCWKYR